MARDLVYGHDEVNGLRDRGHTVSSWQAFLDTAHEGESLHWTDRDLAKITVLRLLSDPGFPVWDVSYCYGERKDGSPCVVTLPFDQLPKRGMRRAIVDYAKRDKVYAAGLGILDNISTLM